jgi:hypothetical protein
MRGSVEAAGRRTSVANTFEDQAQDRFGKAKAFLSKAQALLQDDLVARTVLADAVSAIKNALQGYLLVRVGQSPSHPETQHWQEVAASNRMPDLIGTCMDAGLDIRQLARDIRRLNDERNYRTHDDPHRRIDAEQARRALELARNVAQRVNAAIKGQRAVEIPAPAAPSFSTRVPLHNGGSGGYAAAANRQAPVTVVAASREPSAPAAVAHTGSARATISTPAADESAVAASEDDEAPTTDDTGIFTAVGAGRTRVQRVVTRGGRVARLVATMAGGIAAGLVLAIPLARGGAPGPLASARSWYASVRTVVVSRTAPTQALVPSSTTQSAGMLTVTAPACLAGMATFQLRNTGSTPLAWAVGAPERDESVAFASAPTAAPQPSALGTLGPGASASIYASAHTTQPYPLVVLAPTGAIPLVAPAC